MGQKAAHSFQSPTKGNSIMYWNGSELLWSELGSWQSMPTRKVLQSRLLLSPGLWLWRPGQPFPKPFPWAGHGAHESQTGGAHPLRRPGRARQGRDLSLVREVVHPPGTPRLIPHHLDHPHQPRVRAGKQPLARTQPDPTSRRPPFCFVAVASPRGPPGASPLPTPSPPNPTS